MGVDKARLPLRGLPMAAAVAEVLAAWGDPVTLVRRGEPDGLPWVDRGGQPLRVLYEPDDGEPHPLAGVVRALDDAEALGADAALVSPCDLAGLDVSAVEKLVAARGVAVGPDGRMHPLLAVVPVTWRGKVEAVWRSGGSVAAAMAGLTEVPLPAAVLLNVNRPDDRTQRPLEALAARLPDGIDVARVIAAERSRQRQRGIVDTDPSPVSCVSRDSVVEER